MAGEGLKFVAKKTQLHGYKYDTLIVSKSALGCHRKYQFSIPSKIAGSAGYFFV